MPLGLTGTEIHPKVLQSRHSLQAASLSWVIFISSPLSLLLTFLWPFESFWLPYTKSKSKLKSHLPAPVPPLPGSWRILFFNSSSGETTDQLLQELWHHGTFPQIKVSLSTKGHLGPVELPWLNQFLSFPFHAREQKELTCTVTAHPWSLCNRVSDAMVGFGP